MVRFLSISGLLPVVLGAAAATVSLANSQCEVLDETYIGANRDVKLEHLDCAGSGNAEITARDLDHLQARQTDVCGATCNTNCFPSGGSQVIASECNVIADALRYESQNSGSTFQIPGGTNNSIAMTYSSCLTFWVNQDAQNRTLSYCKTDWASVIDYIAPTCTSNGGKYGGLCLASDGRWFIQVQHTN